jgi:hypothetical protein
MVHFSSLVYMATHRTDLQNSENVSTLPQSLRRLLPGFLHLLVAGEPSYFLRIVSRTEKQTEAQLTPRLQVLNRGLKKAEGC